MERRPRPLAMVRQGLDAGFLQGGDTGEFVMMWLSLVGMTLALVGLVCLGASGPGYRLGLWGFPAGIQFVKVSGWFALMAVGISLASLALSVVVPQVLGGIAVAVGLMAGGTVLTIVLTWYRNLQRAPSIHDITTDTENPPLFEALLPLRVDAENSAGYGGPEIARQQWEAYPDLTMVVIDSLPEAAFERALRASRDMGWKIVRADSDALRIEATDTTWWFGFTDDIVVRLTRCAEGCCVDVRSVSRVGRSDLGTNARRIENYLDLLTD